MLVFLNNQTTDYPLKLLVYLSHSNVYLAVSCLYHTSVCLASFCLHHNIMFALATLYLCHTSVLPGYLYHTNVLPDHLLPVQYYTSVCLSTLYLYHPSVLPGYLPFYLHHTSRYQAKELPILIFVDFVYTVQYEYY